MFWKLSTNLLWAEGIFINVFWFNNNYLGRVDFLIGSQSSDLTDSEPLAAYEDLVFSDTVKNNIIIGTYAWTR